MFTDKFFSKGNLLMDEDGKVMTFYRGGKSKEDFGKRFFGARYLTNNPRIANAYSSGSFFKANVRTKKPLIIDPSVTGQIRDWEYLQINASEVYPVECKEELIRFSELEHRLDTYLSTDEIVEFAKMHRFDCVILVNLSEGMKDGLPITDIIVLNRKILVEATEEDYDAAKSKYEDYIVKNIDLTKYFKSDLQKYVYTERKFEDYKIQLRNVIYEKKQYLGYFLIVNSSAAVRVKVDGHSRVKYLNADLIAPGRYKRTAKNIATESGETTFVPEDGMVEIEIDSIFAGAGNCIRLKIEKQ